MEFETPLQKETYEKVRTWMTELYGEQFKTYDDRPSFSIWTGSSQTFVNVYAWAEDRTSIQCFSWVIIGAEPTEELFQYLLLENNTMRLGAFGIDEENDIFFKYSIVGNTADKAQLRAAINAVTYTADDYDDKITARWGGRRATDR